ncbi:bifunctional diguanylate cyclase/phosphodiesterase [Litchfieldia salsa]|uniref:PAS domain S-box-containing protein/diguanylate cyclase (GGDEF) domain-containing protein n=1 Tax=Litchfieldia salsa TaxID=930152 RepID=A0A1H0RL36_9BACI|nr:bifunctional diguanylate cyclase/phosphodiesterase [Litchfieldia salsa]SDP30223.1 PAS domain S-box-containing protein/diguanylate cyclase (GGDEF) domain-containing protein [Litchfieldia salsa]
MDSNESFFKANNSETKIQDVIFEIILKHINDLVYVMKVEENTFRYVFMNEMALTQARISDDYIGKTFYEALPFEIAYHLSEQYSAVLRIRDAYSFEDNITLPNYGIVYGESKLSPIFDENNKIQFIVCVTRDITGSVLEKRKLDETRQRYKSLIDHNMDAVFSVDLKGNLLQMNPSTYTITGYHKEALLHKAIFSLLHESDRATFHTIFQTTAVGQPNEFKGCRLIHFNGNTLTVHVKTVPIVVDDKVLGIYIIIKDITEQHLSEKMLQYMAFHDQLTGLLNKSSLMKNLHTALEHAKDKQQEIALMYIDLDRFKFINDTMGHDIGDMLLKDLADRLLTLTHTVDYHIYRQGGDEFIVLLENTERELTAEFAEKLLDKLKHPFTYANQEFFVSASIGISQYPYDGEDPETLIKNADTALYIVKNRGRSHFRFYSEKMKRGTKHTMKIETALRKAIVKDELVLYYQPQVDLKSGVVDGFEALLRWQHPHLGFISPLEFIPLAEETGLIGPIGEWVIKKVCSSLCDWKRLGYKPASIAINLSPLQFQQAGLVEFIKKQMIINKLSPGQLEFEITEGAIQDSREALTTLNQLKSLGVKIAVDDFGTGFSSLSYLKRYPIDTLKIDQSFVKDVLLDEKDEAIITTIIHLAHSLGLNVIAEGVEQLEQLELLKLKQCQKAQGYYFSRPIPEEAVIKHYLQDIPNG